MAALCIGQTAVPAVGYECRPDATGAAAGKSFGGSAPAATGGAQNLGKGFFCPPCITRFPPNFVRQLSIKARRNCSNIGVAQVVAASATDRPAAMAAAMAAAPAAEATEGLQLGGGGAPAAAVNGANEVLLESLMDSGVSSFPCKDTQEAKNHPSQRSSTLAVHGGSVFVSSIMSSFSHSVSPGNVNGCKNGSTEIYYCSL